MSNKWTLISLRLFLFLFISSFDSIFSTSYTTQTNPWEPAGPHPTASPRMLRACTRVGGAGAGGRRERLMASLIPFLSSSPYSTHLPRQHQPQPPPAAAAAARPSRFRLLLARAAAPRDDPEPAPAVEERRSLAVRTGELFLGLAALLLRGTGAGAAAVEEVEARDGVVWEQRPEDVDAERARRELTSPGFSFSAAGLLFPYHLGAAQCLMDRGYITVSLPRSF